jgi:hypothetical protein
MEREEIMRRVILGLCHVVLLAYPQRIYINEVMFDAVGADHHTEFVELYNADTLAVLMTGMRIGDALENDAIIPIAGEAEIVLPAGQLLLILDASYADNATVYDSLLAQLPFHAVIDDASFGHSGWSNTASEPVILIAANGDTLDVYHYTTDNEPGYSDEKIYPQSNTIEDNWGNSLFSNGSPGMPNSLTEAAGLIHLSDYSFRQAQEAIDVAIAYLCFAPTKTSMKLSFLHDADFNQRISAADRQLYTSDLIASPGPNQFAFEAPFSGLGRSHFIIQLVSPVDTIELFSYLSWENDAHLQLRLNEIMFAPAAGQAEWLEFYNPHPVAVDFTGIELVIDGDSLYPCLQIPAGDYAVLSNQSEMPIVETGKLNYFSDLPNLKVSGSEIVIYHATGYLLDSIAYSDSWWDGDHEHRSLEKKSVNLTNMPGFWGFSRSPDGSTPGKRNSWAGPASEFDESDFAVNSQILAPNDVGGLAQIEIRIDCHWPGKLNLLVFDMHGRLVQILAENKQVLGPVFFVWEGLDRQGRMLPAGSYVVYAALHESKANWQAKKLIALLP